VLRVNRFSPSKTSQHQGRRSGDEILERDHRERSRGPLQALSAYQRRAELPEQINAQRLIPIYKLKQHLSFRRVGMDMMHEKSVS
jgi:hypothetical protein